MHDGDLSLFGSSRPTTPESFMTNSLDNATAHINDLTAALTNFSRVPSPEPPIALLCCCGRDDCENVKAWADIKTKLESRLVLSAEIGQALLQRHEAYVKRFEDGQKRDSHLGLASLESTPEEYPEAIILRLTEEKSKLERKLNQALVNNEVTEVSNRTILQELQEAQTTVSRLTAHHARSVGWDSKLSAALKERDDMQQERDAESHRARVAESRFVALKDRTTKLQAEVRRLQRDLEERRHVRIESSESTIRDAQTRLENLQRQIGQSQALEHAEFTSVVASLVDDNASLKRDNGELQQLLEETRQEYRSAQEELDEHRAFFNSTPRSATSMRFRGHSHTSSMPSNVIKPDPPLLQPSPLSRRSISQERKPKRLSGIDLDRPLSPPDTISSAHYPLSPFSVHIQGANDEPEEPEQPIPQHRPLLLLSRSRGIQTDPYPAPPSLSPRPPPSPLDPRSESSSFSFETGGTSGHMTILLERMSSLLTRMNEADALTLTNRLRRQNLKGADVGHLSRTTVSTILGEVNALRSSFRPFLEDEKNVLPCTRKEVRSLLRLLKDLFSELGELRITVNDVVLDPSIAPKLSEWALDPVKAEQEKRKLQGSSNSGSSVGGWIAPFSKLFGGSSSASPSPALPNTGAAASLTRSLSSSNNVPRPPPKAVPKIAAATSSSNTTVNVEFSGAGPGRAVTSTTFQGGADQAALDPRTASIQSSSVLSIFAGAPGRISPDPWVVLPRRDDNPRRQPGVPSYRRATMKPGANASRMSRNLDAVIDVETPVHTIQEDEETQFDINAPIMPRTLRRRGMSDSSMHSTFTSHAAEPPNDDTPTTPTSQDAWPSIQALSRRIQSLRPNSPPTRPAPSPKKKRAEAGTSAKAGGFKVPSLMSSWHPSIDMMDGGPSEGSFFVGSMPSPSPYLSEQRSPPGSSRLDQL